MNAPAVDIIPIGGLGQFGMNCTLFRSGDDVAIVDAGMAFPRGEAWGIDAIVPDLGHLLDSGLRAGAILLTHGHEDHIGGLPYVMERTTCPIYGSDLTLGFVRDRLRQHGREGEDRLRPISGGDRTSAGPFTFEAIEVTHSVPGSFALLVETPAGRIVHSADFKLDPTPVDGPPTDLNRLTACGAQGVKVLLLDSTNAGRAGRTPSERRVGEAFGRLLESSASRVFVTTFSSHVHRIQQVIDCAVRARRKVAILGRRMSASMHIARETGRLHVPPGALVSPEEAMALPPGRCVIVAGGSQGESGSAMTRLASGGHPDAAIERGDIVVHSASPIPGNEIAVGRMLDDLARRGADILTSADGTFHVSGHGGAEDLATVIDAVRPETLVPIHGTYRHMLDCAAVGESRPNPPRSVVLAENGDVLRMDADGVRIDGKLDVTPMLVDRELQIVEESVVQERRRLGSDGVLLPLVVLDRSTKRLLSMPRVVARGFAGRGAASLFTEASELAAATVRTASEAPSTMTLEERIEDEIRRLIRKRTGKRPLVSPIVVEV